MLSIDGTTTYYIQDNNLSFGFEKYYYKLETSPIPNYSKSYVSVAKGSEMIYNMDLVSEANIDQPEELDKTNTMEEPQEEKQSNVKEGGLRKFYNDKYPLVGSGLKPGGAGGLYFGSGSTNINKNPYDNRKFINNKKSKKNKMIIVSGKGKSEPGIPQHKNKTTTVIETKHAYAHDPAHRLRHYL